jgi:Zn-dependent M28 family amino/carboxypeptidase
LLGAVLAVSWFMIGMPGCSYRGALPPLSEAERTLRDELKRDLHVLAGEIGERNLERPDAYAKSVEFIERSFTEAGLQPRRESYDVFGKTCHNIVAEIPGRSAELILVGAHHDTVPGSPGANDNGSGVVAVLALARRFAGKPCARTLRFVAFANEEPGHFQTKTMGSWVHAAGCKSRGEQVAAMLSLETIAYFSREPDSQQYPIPLLKAVYPRTGNFIAFVGDTASRKLVREAIGSFRKHAQFPSEGAALPAAVPGVGWSDHWSFWQHGYRAIMITDTAPFRYPHYHRPTDTPDRLDYDSMARVVAGVELVIRDLADK